MRNFSFSHTVFCPFGELTLSVSGAAKIYRLGKSQSIYTLPNDKILTLSKLRTFAEGYFNLAEMVPFFSDTVDIFVRNGENAGYQHFLLFPQCFQKASFPGSLIPFPHNDTF